MTKTQRIYDYIIKIIRLTSTFRLPSEFLVFFTESYHRNIMLCAKSILLVACLHLTPQLVVSLNLSDKVIINIRSHE